MTSLVPAPTTTGGVPARVRREQPLLMQGLVGDERRASGLGESFVESPLTGRGVVVTPRWAIRCYMPCYYRERTRWGDDYDGVYGDIVHSLVPQASIGKPKNGPEHELLRRIDLATCVLFNQDGIPRRHPPVAPFPRPRAASDYSQPWLRALVTGWV